MPLGGELQVHPPALPDAPGRQDPEKFTGLTHNLGQLYGFCRDFQSNFWVDLQFVGQPCEFYLRACQERPTAAG
jgi:hypothetical protein